MKCWSCHHPSTVHLGSNHLGPCGLGACGCRMFTDPPFAGEPEMETTLSRGRHVPPEEAEAPGVDLRHWKGKE